MRFCLHFHLNGAVLFEYVFPSFGIALQHELSRLVLLGLIYWLRTNTGKRSKSYLQFGGHIALGTCLDSGV